MMKWIRETLQKETLQKEPLKKSILKKLELACEEALVNIISYAYDNKIGNIDITLHSNSKRIEITIIDQGRFFNPLLEDRTVNKNLTLEERKEGGLGILMIKKVMDEVHYKRVENTNVLKLVKKFY